MFTTDQVNLYKRNIFKTSLYIYIFQDEKCRRMRNLSLSMVFWCFLSVCLCPKKKHQNSRTDLAQIFVGPRVTQGRVIVDDQIFKPNLT